MSYPSKIYRTVAQISLDESINNAGGVSFGDMPAGTYVLRYEEGAIFNSDDNKYYVHLNKSSMSSSSSSSGFDPYDPGEDEILGDVIVLNNGTSETLCPGNDTSYDSYRECEVGNFLDEVVFDHNGGELKLRLKTENYAILSSINEPRFSLTQKASNGVYYDENSGVNAEYAGLDRDFLTQPIRVDLHRQTGTILFNLIFKNFSDYDIRVRVYYPTQATLIGTYNVTSGTTHTQIGISVTGDGATDYVLITVQEIALTSASSSSSNIRQSYELYVSSPTCICPNGIISYINPPDGSINEGPFIVNLQWSYNPGSEVEPVLGYDIYGGLSTDLTLSYIGTTQLTNFDLVGLLPNTSYKWKIVPYNLCCSYDPNNPSTFTTADSGISDEDKWVRDKRNIDISDSQQFRVSVTWNVPTDVPEITLFRVSYSYSNNVNDDNYTILEDVPYAGIGTYTKTYDLLANGIVSTKDEAKMLFIRKQNSTHRERLRFRISALTNGFDSYSVCGIVFPDSYGASGYRVRMHSTKKQLFINSNSTEGVGGNGGLGSPAAHNDITEPACKGSHEYNEFDTIWISDMPTVFTGGYIMKQPSRCSVDNNKKQGGRAPSVWVAYRGAYVAGEGNQGDDAGLVKFDFYTGSTKLWWKNNTTSPLPTPSDNNGDALGPGTRGISLDVITGDAYSSGNTDTSGVQENISLCKLDSTQKIVGQFDTSAIETAPYKHQNYGSTIDHFGNVWYATREFRRTVRVRINHSDGSYGPASYIEYTTFAGLYHSYGVIANTGTRSFFVSDTYCDPGEGTYGITTDAFGNIWTTYFFARYLNGSYYHALQCFYIDPSNEDNIATQIFLINTTYTRTGTTGVVTDKPRGQLFNVWFCTNTNYRVYRVAFLRNPVTNRYTMQPQPVASLNLSPYSLAPHGIAVDSDNNIWAVERGPATGSATRVVKIYQKASGTQWGVDSDSQGGDVVWPNDPTHSAYNDYNITGTAPGGMTWRQYACQELHGKQLYPGFSTAVIDPSLGLRYKIFTISDYADFRSYMYSDFTGQVMKMYSTSTILFESDVDYNPIYMKVD